MDVPKLIIVAEHDTCLHTEQWLAHLILLANRLKEFPDAMLQIRAKTKPSLRIWAYDQLPRNPRIVINGMVPGTSFPFVHLPQSQVQKTTQSFGMSIHHPQDPDQYDELGPQYYQLGPIFSPISKKGSPKGLSLITETKKRTRTPIIAVGGITPGNTTSVMDAGAYGIASSGFVLRSSDPLSALYKLYKAVDNY